MTTQGRTWTEAGAAVDDRQGAELARAVVAPGPRAAHHTRGVVVVAAGHPAYLANIAHGGA